MHKGKPTRATRGALMIVLVLSARPALTVAAPGVLLDGIAATVGTFVIMRSDVRLARDLGLVPPALDDREAVGRLVERALMVAEVNRFQAPAPLVSAVDARFAELRQTVGAAAWDRAVRRAGIDDESVKELVRDQLRIDGYLRQRFSTLATPSEEELRQAYDERQSPSLRVTIIPPFDTVKDRLRDELARAKFDALVTEWVNELRARADVALARTPPDTSR